MLRVLATLLVALAPGSAAPVAQADDGLAREFHGVVTALTATGMSIREPGGATTFLTYRGAAAITAAEWNIQPGLLVDADGWSDDGGATWSAMRVYLQNGVRTSATGLLWQRTPSQVEILTRTGGFWSCSVRPGTALGAAAVGRSVLLTCRNDRGLHAVALQPTGTPPVKSYTVSGTVSFLDGTTLALYQAGAVRNNSYTFTVRPQDLAKVQSVATSAAQVTVVAKPVGRDWVVVSVKPQA